MATVTPPPQHHTRVAVAVACRWLRTATGVTLSPETLRNAKFDRGSAADVEVPDCGGRAGERSNSAREVRRRSPGRYSRSPCFSA